MSKPVRVSIITDVSGDGIAKARAQLDDLERKLPGATEGVERHGLAHRKLSDFAGGAGDRIRDFASVFTSRLGPAGKQADDVIGGLTDRIGNMSLGQAAAAGGVAALGAALFKLGQAGVDAFVELGAKVKSFQEASGASAETSSVLVDALDDLGIGAETGATAMARLARNIVNNKDSLAAHGVEMATTKDGLYDAWGTLGNVAEAFSNAKDHTDKAAIGNAAFGRSWAQLAPLLEGGRANLEEIKKEAERLGIVLSQDDVTAAHEFEQSLVRLKDSADGLKIKIGREVVPILTDSAEGLSAIGETASKASGGFLSMGNAVNWWKHTNPVGIAVNALGALGDLAGGTDKAADATDALAKRAQDLDAGLAAVTMGTEASDEQIQLYAESVKQASAAFQAYTQSASQSRQATEELTNAHLTGASVELQYEQATLNVANQLRNQTQAENEARAAIDAHGAESAEAQAASANLAGQTIQTKESFIRQAEAAVTLASKVAEAAGSHLTAEQKAAVQREEYGRLAASMEPGSPLRVYLEGLISRIDAIPTSKKVRIDIEENYRAVGRDGSAITVRAAGGPTPGGMVLVGERGPELVRLPKGSQVTPNHLAGGADAAGVTNIYVNVETNADPDEIGRAVAWHRKTSGR